MWNPELQVLIADPAPSLRAGTAAAVQEAGAAPSPLSTRPVVRRCFCVGICVGVWNALRGLCAFCSAHACRGWAASCCHCRGLCGGYGLCRGYDASSRCPAFPLKDLHVPVSGRACAPRGLGACHHQGVTNLSSKGARHHQNWRRRSHCEKLEQLRGPCSQLHLP